MSKYNLVDMLPEGMNDNYISKKDLEFMQNQKDQEMAKRPDADVAAAIAKMMQDEKDVADLSKKGKGVIYRVKEEDNLDEMRNVDYERLDGMIDQSLLNKLLNTAVSIKLDFEANDEPFENSDIVDFIANLMEKRLDQVDATPSQDEMDPDERERLSIDMDDVREHFNRFK